jgi:hypothetical protein
LVVVSAAPVAAVLAAFVFVSLTIAGAAAQDASPALAIDADATGNTANTVGTREVCIAVEPGQVFDIDIIGENLTGLSAWEAYLKLDTNVVHVIDRDVNQLLVSVPGSNVFDISESVPEDNADNGLYRVGGAIITDPPIGVDGTGVLARLTLKAQEEGVSDLSLRTVISGTGEPVGPVLTDKDGQQIADSDGDTFFDGPILDARVAVGTDCPAAEGEQGAVSVLQGDDGGVPTWIIVGGIALGVVVAAGFGGLALIRLRRAGPHDSV